MSLYYNACSTLHGCGCVLVGSVWLGIGEKQITYIWLCGANINWYIENKKYKE
jgi:hypothetical protein